MTASVSVENKSTSSGFVTVACKLPVGLTVVIPAIGEQREQRVSLNGKNSPFASFGHGMTQVKTDTWAAIQMLHGDSLWLKNEHVFALPDSEDATAKAKERKSVDAGFDPVDPDAPNKVRGASAIQKEGTPDKG